VTTADPQPAHAPTDAAYAEALDAADPLAHHRGAFLGAETPLVYLDGNSLGRPLAATPDRLAAFVREEWGGRLIRGWDESWFDLPLAVGDRIGETCLGAAPGQTTIGDSTTVLLYKLVRAGVDLARRRDRRRDTVVIGRDDFPTDRYVVEGVAAELGLQVRWIEVDRAAGLTAELLAAALDERVALVVASHVAYRSGHLADLEGLTALAHESGALVLWDLCHSVGVVPTGLDEAGVDLAVGCSYKYLNGGPGSPAFGYVAERLLDEVVQPVQGWMGAVDPFEMGPAYRPTEGIRRILSGTPPVVGMLPVRDMLELLGEAGVPAVREKSVALTEYAVRLADDWLAPLGVALASPRDPAWRGGHVTLSHPRMREVVPALWCDDVLPDYRDPDGLRIGLSPLSTSFAEVHAGIAAVRELLR
jgi:kynureninase